MTKLENAIRLGREIRSAEIAVDNACGAARAAQLEGSEALALLDRASAIMGQAVAALEPAFDLQRLNVVIDSDRYCELYHALYTGGPLAPVDYANMNSFERKHGVSTQSRPISPIEQCKRVRHLLSDESLCPVCAASAFSS